MRAIGCFRCNAPVSVDDEDWGPTLCLECAKLDDDFDADELGLDPEEDYDA